ncbi:MAG: sugar transferase [Fibromonadales bacterium]|nr:sugar transferase [Fibromonadales bacterium]
MASTMCFLLFFPERNEFAAFAVLVWLLIFLCAGFYRRWLLDSRTAQVLHILKTVCIAYCFAIVALFGYYAQNLHGFFNEFRHLTGYFFFVWFLTSSIRLLICKILRIFLNRGWGADCILLLGNENETHEYSHLFHSNPQLGKKVIDIIEEDKYADLPNLIKKNNVQAIVIAHRNSSEKKINEILYWVAHLPVQVYLVPNLWECAKNFKMSSQPTLIHTKELQELFVLNLLPWQATIKRIMDIAIAVFLLLATSPLLLLTAIAIKLDSRGSVLYKQQRVGLYSRPFTIYKFRSMYSDAEKNGPQWAKKNDSRVTKVGKIIRKFRIDEIPQLLCVLKGNMSMVGPRPERAVFIEELRKTIPFYASRLKMKPGLTGWAQVRHHYDNDIEDVKIKLGYDIYYLSNASILLDIQILIRTIYVVLTGKGAQ